MLVYVGLDDWNVSLRWLRKDGRCFQHMAQFTPKLKSLNLEECHGVADEQLLDCEPTMHGQLTITNRYEQI
jgi:hypothetical protein